MTNAAIAASAIVADAAPYIVALSSVVVPGLVAMGLDQLRRLTGLRLQQAAADRLDAMIEDEVGALVAAASDNLATTSIPLGSPIVAAIATRIIAAAPDLLARADRSGLGRSDGARRDRQVASEHDVGVAREPVADGQDVSRCSRITTSPCSPKLPTPARKA